MAINPKSLIFQLHKHWDLVEQIVRAAKDMPIFSETMLMKLISQQASGYPNEDAAAILRSLTQSDLLHVHSRSEGIEVNPLVLEFVLGLTLEHELGLSSVLKARIDAIKEASTQLNASLEDGDMDKLQTAARNLSTLFRDIQQQLERDRHAIMGIAEKAKSSDVNIPIVKRYRAVLDAYDHYVEPMNEMMDTGLDGTFYPYLETAEKALDHANDQLTIRGGLYSFRLQMRQVAYQAKELRRFGRIVAQHCADTLLPLREEARQNNQLSSAIGTLLGAVRKKGLLRTFNTPQLTSQLPLWKADRPRRVHVGDEILSIMAQARNFEPQFVAFPQSHQEILVIESWIDEAKLHQHIHDSLPINNLLEWLYKHYPLLPDQTLLRLYHDVIRLPHWQCDQTNTESATALNQIRVRHYPHHLTFRS